MSYAALIFFRDGKADSSIEYRNAWGGSARIWDALFDRYIKDPRIPYHSWIMGDQQPLWDLAKRKDIKFYERSVHAFTFENAVIERRNFGRFADDLRAFSQAYPVTGKVCHLAAWANTIQSSVEEAVGLHGTSVSENPWFRYDEEKDDTTPVPLSEGWEVYYAIEQWDSTPTDSAKKP